MSTKIRIATRGSRLALWQAQFVASQLKNKGYDSELKIIKTKGDIVQDRFLHEIGGKGLFVKELEQSLIEGTSDIAVHSLKDLPARTPEPFCLAAILPRHRPGDVMIMKPDFVKKLPAGNKPISAKELLSLPSLTLATASLRRQALIKGAAPKARLEPVRGNVDTRIEKLKNGDWDALILASASVERLGLNQFPNRELDSEWFIPAPAQGALAIESLASSPYRSIVASLSCPATTAHVTMEREILAILGGDCTMPFGSFISYDPSTGFTTGSAVVLNAEGLEARTSHKIPGDWSMWKQKTFVDMIVKGLFQNGAEKILHDLKIQIPDLGFLT